MKESLIFSFCLFIGWSLNGVCNRSLVAPSSGPGTLSRPRPLVVATQREPEGVGLAPGDGRISKLCYLECFRAGTTRR